MKVALTLWNALSSWFTVSILTAYLIVRFGSVNLADDGWLYLSGLIGGIAGCAVVYVQRKSL